jgi:hypothetical protein
MLEPFGATPSPVALMVTVSVFNVSRTMIPAIVCEKRLSDSINDVISDITNKWILSFEVM